MAVKLFSFPFYLLFTLWKVNLCLSAAFPAQQSVSDSREKSTIWKLQSTCRPEFTICQERNFTSEDKAECAILKKRFCSCPESDEGCCEALDTNVVIETCHSCPNTADKSLSVTCYQQQRFKTTSERIQSFVKLPEKTKEFQIFKVDAVDFMIHMADGQFGTLGTAITRLNGNLLKQRKTGNWTQVFLSIPLRDELEITFQSQVPQDIIYSYKVSSERSVMLFGGGYSSSSCAKSPSNILSRLFSWEYSSFSDCSADCGQGIRIKHPHCRFNGGTPANDNDCCRAGLPKPDPIKEGCGTEICSPRWTTSPWGSCSETCGTGFKIRTVNCVRDISDSRPPNLLEDSECDSLSKPNSTAECEDISLCVAVWKTGNWSECSNPCGQGNQTRDVVCYTKNNNTADDSACATLRKPSAEQNCTGPTTCNFVWYEGSWGKCIGLCERGDNGSAYRTVKCYVESATRSSRVDDRYCLLYGATEQRPVDMKSCSLTCAPRWVINVVLNCSVTCGTGVSIRQVTCRHSNGSDASNLCESEKPSQYVPCHQPACPTSPCADTEGINCNDIVARGKCDNYYKHFCCECKRIVSSLSG